MVVKELIIDSLEDMGRVASDMAGLVQPGDVLCLTGDLGVGKTTFARFFIRSFLGEEEEVPSPTFTLLQTFDVGKFSIWHFDLYRLKNQEEVYSFISNSSLYPGIFVGSVERCNSTNTSIAPE